MTNEEKQLLLKDLCARLPYGIFVKENRDSLDDGPVIYTFDYHPYIFSCKPYLRPMESMTEEEKLIYHRHCICRQEDGLNLYYNTESSYDYLNSIHVDYRGLIVMELALPAPEGMYETKKEKR